MHRLGSLRRVFSPILRIAAEPLGCHPGRISSKVLKQVEMKWTPSLALIGRHCSVDTGPENAVFKPVRRRSENDFARRVLESIDSFNKDRSIVAPAREMSSEVQETLNRFQSSDFDKSDQGSVLSLLQELSGMTKTEKKNLLQSEVFWELCASVTEAVPQFSKENFLQCMKYLCSFEGWGHVPGKFVAERNQLLASFRLECGARASDLSCDELLFVLNFLSAFKTRNVPQEIFSTLGSQVRTMGKEEVLQILYYISLFRNSDIGLLQELEDKLEEDLEIYTHDELAVVSLGFFKSRHMIRSEIIIDEILARLRRSVCSMDEMCIVALLKCATYSISRDQVYRERMKSDMHYIMKSIYPRLAEFQNSTCTNIFRLTHSLRQVDHNFIDAMCQRVTNSGLGQWRLKDLSFFLFRFTSFQAMVAEKDWFYGLFVNELELSSRKEEILQFPRCLLQSLTGLAYMGIYPQDLINECLSPSFRKLLLEKSNMDPMRELYVLDQSVEIECPDYTGCRIPSDFISKVPKDHEIIHNTRLPHEKRDHSQRDDMLLDVQAQLDMLFEGMPVAEISFVLPFLQTADIMIEVDSKNEICEISQWVTREMPRKGHKRIVLICAAPNVYHIYETEYGHSRKISGIHVMKRRQLQKLGYTVIEIPYFEWRKSNREVYLKKLLAPHVKM